MKTDPIVKLSAPSIQLLTSADCRAEAWKISRPYITGDVDLAEIEKVDLPVNTMKVVYLHIKCSAAFRELLTTMRPFFAWTQSSRVNKLEDFEFPMYSNAESVEYYGVLQQEAIRGLGSSHQDAARLAMPLAHMTEISIGMDFRSWISFLKSLKEIYPKYFKIYGSLIISNLDLKLNDIDEYPFAKAIVNNWSNDEKNFRSGTQEVGRQLVTRGSISVSLRTQLIRHIPLKLHDDLFWNPEISESVLERVRLDAEIDSVIYTQRESWIRMLSHRSCYIAQYEMYDGFIKSYVGYQSINRKDFTEEFVKLLPCHAKQCDCPFKKDMESRLNGTDPGLLCPIWGYDTTNDREKLMGKSFTNDMFKLISK